jgi:hypothetical protein
MGILLVYDVTDEKSFGNIRNWIRNIEQHASESVNKVSQFSLTFFLRADSMLLLLCRFLLATSVIWWTRRSLTKRLERCRKTTEPQKERRKRRVFFTFSSPCTRRLWRQSELDRICICMAVVLTCCRYGLKFMEASAKSNINVEEAFVTLAKDIKVHCPLFCFLVIECVVHGCFVQARLIDNAEDGGQVGVACDERCVVL